jgi:hypothetical protein
VLRQLSGFVNIITWQILFGKIMSAFTDSYRLRYQIASVQQQIEVAVIHAASDIRNEDPAIPDHANRLSWANWANSNSSVAWIPFAWPVGMNPAIGASVAADPSGQSVSDNDVQFVVDSNLDAVIAVFVANPP